MTELSLNVLDICQNSIVGKASVVEIIINEDVIDDLLTITIKDDGIGMTEELVARVSDPFTTTRTTRKVGMGIPLFKMAAEMADGNFKIKSAPGKGTIVSAAFRYSHIDRMPIGDIKGTIITLIQLNPNIDFVYTHTYNANKFVLDTRKIRKTLGDEIPLNNSDVIMWIDNYLKEQYKIIYRKADK